MCENTVKLSETTAPYAMTDYGWVVSMEELKKLVSTGDTAISKRWYESEKRQAIPNVKMLIEDWFWELSPHYPERLEDIMQAIGDERFTAMQAMIEEVAETGAFDFYTESDTRIILDE